MGQPYVDFRLAPGDWDRKDVFGVPEWMRKGGHAWRIVVPLAGGVEASSVIAFARRKDAEAALAAINKASGGDTLKLMKIPFDERTRIMLEALQW